jgi:hypothetical protein
MAGPDAPRIDSNSTGTLCEMLPRASSKLLRSRQAASPSQIRSSGGQAAHR